MTSLSNHGSIFTRIFNPKKQHVENVHNQCPMEGYRSFHNTLLLHRICARSTIHTSSLFHRESINMRITTLYFTLLIVAVAIMATAMIDAFSVTTTNKLQPSSALRMAPKFVGNKWVPQTPEDGPEAGYDVIGTILRQGPEPALTRIFSPDDYEQAVLKFMATEKCDRNTAQGNMDAYLRNPPDWTYVRLEDQKRGYVRDYVSLKPLEVGKVLVWSTIVFALVGRTIYALSTGNRFNL